MEKTIQPKINATNTANTPTCSIEPVDANLAYLDEQNDIYPCKKYFCKCFHKSPDKYASLLDAIYYLKPLRVKELLETFDETEILNPKLCRNASEPNNNLLTSTIGYIGGTSGVGVGIPAINKIGVYAFRNSSSTRFPNQVIGAKLFLEIIEIICAKFPWMVTERAYLYPNAYNISAITSILNKYYKNNANANTILCSICKLSSPNQFIKNVCKCENSGAHLTCLVEQVRAGLTTCAICSNSYGSYTCPRGKISFPSLGIYAEPLISTYKFIPLDDKFTRLKYASLYLIETEVKKLLDDFSAEEFIKFANETNDNDGIYIKYEDEQTLLLENKCPIILMSRNPYSNLFYKNFPDLHAQTNALLFSKCIDCNNYACSSLIDISWGKYLYCENMSSPTGSGFTLVPYSSTNTDIYGDPFGWMILLKLNMSMKLLRDTSFIDIYDEKDRLFGYNTKQFNKSFFPSYKFFKKISPDMIGTELRIEFSKEKKLTQEEQEQLRRTLRRTPRELIYTINVKITEPVLYGDTTECVICLNNIDNNSTTPNKYISPCGHTYHLDCVFDYVRSKNLLYPIHMYCNNKTCCGASKIKPFECAVCKRLIEK